MAQGVSRPDGAFEFRALAEGPYYVAACLLPPGRFGGTNEFQVVSDVSSDSENVVVTLPMEVTPSQRVDVVGRAFDAATKRPLTALRVRLVEDFEHWAEITAPGEFRFRAVPPGTWTAQAYADGFMNSADVEVRVEAGKPCPPVELPLVAGVTVHGVVTAPEGVELTGAPIEFYTEGGEGQGPIARVARDGTYVAKGLQTCSYVVRVARDYVPETPRIDLSNASGDSRFDLTVAKGGTLEWSATQDVRRIASARRVAPVQAPGARRRAPAAPSDDPTILIEICDVAGRAIVTHRLGGGGGGAQTLLAPGRYVLRARPSIGEAKEIEVVVRAGEITRTTTFRFE